MLHSPLTSIFLGVLAFSLLVAGLDFAKRSAGHRILEAMGRPIPTDPQPKVVKLQMNPAAESRIAAPIGRIANLPLTIRDAPGLPFGDFLALPKPNPRLPRNREYLHDSVSWWKGA
jgi:hypothetical protein